LKYPAAIEVGARATRLGRSSVDVEYRLALEGESEAIAEGRSTIVWVDYSSGRSTPWPEALRDAIVAWDGLPQT
jgi:acyl-CoA thioester hydrolase